MKYGTHGYCGKGKTGKNQRGNIVPQVSGFLSGASKRKQAERRPVKQEEPIFPAETAAA